VRQVAIELALEKLDLGAGELVERLEILVRVMRALAMIRIRCCT